jgi:anti-sigma factor RsiW
MESGPREEPLHDIAALLPAYLNATLSDEERYEVEQHLETCPVCRQELEEFRQLRQAIAVAHTAYPGPSANLFQRVMAQIDQEPAVLESAPAVLPRARHPWWKSLSAWLESLFAHRWGPVLATGLIAAQFVIIIGFVGYFLGGEAPPPPGRQVPGGPGIFVPSVQWQAAIQTTQELGSLAAAHSSIAPQSLTLGFSGVSRETKSFLIGTLYAEALAYVRSERRAVAAQHVAAIERELQALAIPSSSPLPSYMHTAHTLVQHQTYNVEVVGRYLGLFQPLYEGYASTQSPALLPLFRAGAWSVDMTLAAAANDKALLRQEGNVQYLRQALPSVDAPQGAVQALEELGQVVAQPELSARDVQQILKLLKKFQNTLE